MIGENGPGFRIGLNGTSPLKPADSNLIRGTNPEIQGQHYNYSGLDNALGKLFDEVFHQSCSHSRIHKHTDDLGL